MRPAWPPAPLPYLRCPTSPSTAASEPACGQWWLRQAPEPRSQTGAWGEPPTQLSAGKVETRSIPQYQPQCLLGLHWVAQSRISRDHTQVHPQHQVQQLLAGWMPRLLSFLEWTRMAPPFPSMCPSEQQSQAGIASPGQSCWPPHPAPAQAWSPSSEPNSRIIGSGSVWALPSSLTGSLQPHMARFRPSLPTSRSRNRLLGPSCQHCLLANFTSCSCRHDVSSFLGQCGAEPFITCSPALTVSPGRGHSQELHFTDKPEPREGGEFAQSHTERGYTG